MKRVINGVTYNTDTSTLLAEKQTEGYYNPRHWDDCIERLYKTRAGHYFLAAEFDFGRPVGAFEQDIRYTCRPLSEDEVRGWIAKGDVHVHHDPFAPLADDGTPTAFLLRLPPALKQRLEQAAKDAGLSGNAWAVRCLERCVSASASEVTHG